MVGALIGALLIGSAAAQDVQINIDPALAAQYDVDPTEAENRMSSEIDTVLKVANVDEFLSAMANANAIVTSGMGVDYATNPQKFVVGFGAGAGSHSTSTGAGKGGEALPLGGFAANASIMAGFNLGAFADEDSFLKRVMIYGHGFAYTPPAAGEFQSNFLSYGVHGQVKLVPRWTAKVVEVGGLDFTTGYQAASFGLGLQQDIPIETNASGAELEWKASGDYQLKASTSTIPLELSTNFRVLILTLYGGGGVNINSGSADVSASMDGPVTATAQGQSERIGTASVSLQRSGAVEMAPKVFGGVQLNILVLKAYAHATYGINGSTAAHFGGRVAL